MNEMDLNVKVVIDKSSVKSDLNEIKQDLGSVSDKADNTFLKSPTAGMSNSSLNLPVEEPSSHTDTTALISMGNSFNPFRRVDCPVPPPITTTFFIFLPHILSRLYQKKEIISIDLVLFHNVIYK